MPPGHPKRSLILAGGGLKVAFQAGVLQVWLDEAGLTFDHVDGASGGVFNLAMMCQGLSGRQIADNWRKTNPADGVSVNFPRLGQLEMASSMFTMDAYRNKVFPNVWKLDWPKINASPIDATFNVYNFTQHELEVLTPAQMTEDMLCACVSLPMWFPPVEMNGDTYIDPVYVTDANIEEALNRGADEIWVIWTVSRAGTWKNGFVNNYFQIIETAANGNYNRLKHRIEANNRKQAAGQQGEYGRHIELKELAFEVSMHYLINLSPDRMIEAVNFGVKAGREWCQANGIAFNPLPDPPPPPAQKAISLEFTEQMKGFLTKGTANFQEGFDTGKRNKSDSMVKLTIHTDNVAHFAQDPHHAATASGYFKSTLFGGKRDVEKGFFELFVDQADPTRKRMNYRLWFTDDHGQKLTMLGFKDVKDDQGPDEWEDTTTLFTRVMKGHLMPADDAGAELLAAGIIKIQPLDFLAQMTTFRLKGGSIADQLGALTQFGRLFMGKLWDVYGQNVLPFGPI